MDAPDIPDLEYPNGQLARYHRYGEGSVKAVVRESELRPESKHWVAVWYFHRIDGSAIELPRTSSHFPILDGLEKPGRELIDFTLGPVKPETFMRVVQAAEDDSLTIELSEMAMLAGDDFDSRARSTPETATVAIRRFTQVSKPLASVPTPVFAPRRR